ncbi:hypothetical protein [Schleiferilactobacillus harbinensis]|uniref:hypothetical protein n=1 Tax=Schleiferilactobacillus harbinensis TaxID=304207 RepID=UPI00186B7EDA|nr:hypothetical protein [Schleiferilactobacillus harbinensis]
MNLAIENYEGCRTKTMSKGKQAAYVNYYSGAPTFKRRKPDRVIYESRWTLWN